MNNRSRQKDKQNRNDGMMNVISGMGTSEYDSSRYNRVVHSQFITKETSEILFCENGIFNKIICAPADEMVRAGFCVKYKDDEEDKEEDEDRIESIFEDLNGEQTFATALYWHRCYGGGVIMPVFYGGGDNLLEPLDENSLRSIEELRVFSAKEVQPYTKELDPSNQMYGKVKTYTINDESTGASFQIHASRLIIFSGGVVPNHRRNERDGWGGMILEQVFDDLINKYDHANNCTVKLLERISQGVLKVQQLMTTLSSEGGDNIIRKYLQNIDMTRSIMNTLAIDGQDEFDLKNVAMTGVKDVLDKTQMMLSAVSRIPVTILFGRSAAGQNATGDSDFEQYYAYVDQERRRTVKPRLSKLIYWISMCKEYGITLPDSWHIEFKPLSIPSEKEEAETCNLKAQAAEHEANVAKTYSSIGALDTIEIRDKLDSEGWKLNRTLDNTGGVPTDGEGI